MISFSVTPFTDFPAHHYIRSYFMRNKHESGHTTVDLSHLWSEERRQEEHRFDELMNNLTAMAKEVGAVVSCAEDSVPSSDAPLVDLTSSGCQKERIYSYLDRHSAPPPILPAYNAFCANVHTDDSLRTGKEERQDRWLNVMNARVQTLLQEAHQVLGTTVTALGYPETSSDSSEEDVNKSSGSIGPDEGSTSFDVVPLYAHNESSFTSEGPTLLDDVQDSASCDNAIVIHSSSGDGWLLDDTSMHTTHTPLFLDKCLDKVDSQTLTERIHDGVWPEACASIQDLVEHSDPLGV
ncbi:hypothetical protein JOM56_013973 [Amanita muscaria]